MTDASIRVAELLRSCGTRDPVMPATVLYNEGWMLRLVLDWFAHHDAGNHPLSFSPGARWYSEVLLPTQFRARRRGDDLAESHTHADGVIGHFRVLDGRGDIRLDTDGHQLTVVEAKMFSGLAAGVKRAPAYNQAARNVACMVEVLARVAPPASTVERLSFVVLAPSAQITRGIFGDLLTKEQIQGAVRQRVESYGGEKDDWYARHFVGAFERLDVHLLSWEDVISTIAQADPVSGESLREFMAACFLHNGGIRVT